MHMTRIFEAEQDRWALWIPVCLAAGIGLYFALPTEPPIWLGISVTSVVASATLLSRRFPAIFLLLVGLAVGAAGFTTAQIRTFTVMAPQITSDLVPTQITGQIAAIATLPDGNRLTIAHPRISRLAANRTPERVRLRLRGDQPDLVPGDWITIRAGVMSPPAPTAPGAFDFQRHIFFQGVGGIGFSLGRAEILPEGDDPKTTNFALKINRMRQAIGDKVRATIGGSAGAVAAALLTGDRGTIPQETLDAMRDSGLAHLLAISGLHIGLVAGILFVGVRALLALVPPLALRYPIKKWAAFVAIPGAFAYAVIAGGTIPTQRAFLMIGLVLVAVLFDRRGISLRMVAWAAAIILLIEPESLLGASFQMSFAAVVALIAGYEAVARWRRAHRREPMGWLGRIGAYVIGVGLTTLIAGSATAPFAIYHFNRYAAFGLAANLIAVPLTALWIMPWAVIAALLMPFGLEGPALAMMGLGIDGVIGAAGMVAAWPGAVALLPAMPIWGLIAVALGGLWLCLWRGTWRRWGVIAIAAGLGSLLLVRSPDVLIDGAGRLLAVRGADGRLTLSSTRAASFVRASWLRRGGQDPVPAEDWPRGGTSRDGWLACDGLGCFYQAKGRTVALAMRADAQAEDCWSADVVIATVPLGRSCKQQTLVIDRFDLARDGAHAIYLDRYAIRIESANGLRGDRPWVPKRRKRFTGNNRR